MTKFNPQRNSTVVAELKLLNPWVDNTDYGDDVVQLARALLGDVGPISEKAHFEQRLATMGRFAAGRETWNVWAREMLEIRGLAGSDPALGAVCDALAIANFSGARFTEDVDFAALVFPGRADFSGSEFEASAWFQGSTFYGNAVFRQVSFMGEAGFECSTFYALADFSHAMFLRPAEFRQIQILCEGLFEFTDFASCAWFGGSSLANTSFAEARFGHAAGFAGCEFSGPVSFSRAMFGQSLSFEGARFAGQADLTEIIVDGAAWFDDAEFAVAPKHENAQTANGDRLFAPEPV